MKPIFTIHAGEYIVGSFLEDKKLNVWIPSRDTGIDLLVSNEQNTKIVSLQVKFSKDFLATHMDDYFQENLMAWGWWTLNAEKIQQSKADFWVFVLYSFNKKDSQYLIIKPELLLQRLKALNKVGKSLQIYFWVTNKNTSWETRGLSKVDQKNLADGNYTNQIRDFSEYLGNWEQVFSTVR